LYPLLWNKQGAGIHLYSQNEWSFRQEVVKIKRNSMTRIPVDIWVLNGTGNAIFVKRLEENPGLTVRWRTHTVTSAGEYDESGSGAGGKLSGYGDAYDLLDSRDWNSGKALPIDGKIIIDVHTNIPVSGYDDEHAKYTEVEIEFPFIYYTIGATKPGFLLVRRSMRIDYEE